MLDLGKLITARFVIFGTRNSLANCEDIKKIVCKKRYWNDHLLLVFYSSREEILTLKTLRGLKKGRNSQGESKQKAETSYLIEQHMQPLASSSHPWTCSPF